MKILYIDTSTSYLYMGIVDNCKTIYELKKKYAKDLSKYTIYEIEKMFKSLDLVPNDIDKIIVVSGPGSFTGIRIGMTFSKVFAWSLKKEIISITSLEAMKESVISSKLVVPVIDARRGYVYAGIYDNNNVILENQYIKLEKLLSILKQQSKEYIFITNDDLELQNTVNYDPNILNIVKTFVDKKGINPHLVEPTYLKLVEAEENLEK